jgi:hypothetical protein
MAMTADQSTKLSTLSGKSSDFQAAIEVYAAKAAALVTAQTQAAAAQTALDAAYLAWVAAGGTFTGAFPLPAGYTPPPTP